MKNNRTFLEKLLDGAEVQYEKLSDVLPIKRGKRVVRNELDENGIYPVYQNSLQPLGYFNNKNCEAYTTFVIAAGAAGEIGFSEVEFWAADDCYYFECPKEVLNNKFLYYVLMSQKHNLLKKVRKASIPRLGKDTIEKLSIPIPPLYVQTEIVKILDALTALTSELTSELTLRRKQYEYYREKLLSFDSLEQLNMGGAKKKLIDVAYFQNGKGHEKNIDENGSFIVINSKFISTNGAVKKYCNDQLVPLFKEDILIVMSDLPNGKALAKTFFVTEDNKYTLNQRIGRITVKEGGELLPSFVNHFLNRNKQLTKYDNGTDQTNLRKDQILDVVIPIPPLEQQQRIVSILDKFETLTNSITEGLPLAIEQSQKRYEYYRELLLNFE